MTAKLYDFLAFKKRKKLIRPHPHLMWETQWIKSAEEWDAEQEAKIAKCKKCGFWGIEPGVNKPGCTHQYRNFYENCPLEGK